MPRQLLPWCCMFGIFLAVLCGRSASAATVIIVPKQVFPDFYFSPTNVTINVGDTVVWTNFGINNHSLEASPTNASEQFCGTGTNYISNCAVTFQTPGVFFFDCFQHRTNRTGSLSMTGTVTVVAAPVVTITNPPNNSIFPTHADVQVSAQATDADGTVTNVQFLNNGTSFSTST